MTSLPTRISVAAVSAATFLLPLLFVRGVYDFTRWPRLLALQIVVVAILTCLLQFVKKSEDQPSGRLVWMIAAFVGWQILSVFWAPNKIEAAFRASQIATFGFFALATAYALFWQGVRDVLRTIGLVTSLVSIICIAQYWGLAFSSIPTAGNPSATFGYRNFLATYLVTVLPTIAIAAWLEDRPRVQQGLIVACALAVTALLCTRTRGAWLALTATCLATGTGFVAFGGLRSALGSFTPKRAAFGLLAAVLVGLVGLRPPNMVQEGQFKIDENKADPALALQTSFSPSASRGRTTVWENTLSLVRDYPMIGVGLGNWQFVYPLYDQGDAITTNVAPQRPHNDPLWILAETGLVGLILYVLLLATVLERVVHHWKSGSENAPLLVAMSLGVLAYLVHSLFSFPLERIASTAVFWLFIGSVAALDRETGGDKQLAIVKPTAILGICLLLLGSGLTIQRLRFDWHYAKAVEAWRRSDWGSVAHSAAKALTIGPFDFRVYQLLGAGYQSLGRHAEALEAFRTSLTYHPNEGNLPLGDLLFEMGRYEAAIAAYQTEAGLFPNRVAAHLGTARAHLALKDWHRAMAAAKRTIDLNVNQLDAHIIVAEAAEGRGDLVTARGAYERLLHTRAASARLYSRYGEMMDRSGHTALALKAYRRAAEMEPKEAKYLNNVGVVLERQGNHKESADAFRAAIQVDPAYARAYRNLGDILEKAGKEQEAIDAYRRFIEHWSGDPRHKDWARHRIHKLQGS